MSSPFLIPVLRAPFLQLCEGVGLFVHEATFGNDQEEKAAHDCHSTFEAAIATTAAAHAEAVVLTHLSARWESTIPKARVWLHDGGEASVVEVEMWGGDDGVCLCLIASDLFGYLAYCPSGDDRVRAD